MELLCKGLAENYPYKVVILDLAMPGLSGMHMAREISQDAGLSDLPLILHTTFDSAGLGVQAIELGFKGYVTKPVKHSQLLDCLMTVVCSGQSISRLVTPMKDASEQKIVAKN